MDEAVVKFYRRMLRTGFEHTGSLENPSIFLDTVGEKIYICGPSGNYYLHLYIGVTDGVIEEVKYLCTCDPTANVAVEILCTLINGRTLKDAQAMREECFIGVLGGASADLLKRAKGLLELLNRGIQRYQEQAV